MSLFWPETSGWWHLCLSCSGPLGFFLLLGLAGCTQLTGLDPTPAKGESDMECVSERGVRPLHAHSWSDTLAAAAGPAAPAAGTGTGSQQGCSWTRCMQATSLAGTGERSGAQKLENTRHHRTQKRQSQQWPGELPSQSSPRDHSSFLLFACNVES